MKTSGKQIKVTMQQKDGEPYEEQMTGCWFRGALPNTEDLGLRNTKVTTDPKGFIEWTSSSRRRTQISSR